MNNQTIEKQYHSKLNNPTITESKNNNSKKKSRSICYQIKTENQLMKCSRFYLMKDDKIIFMAKQKYDRIYISEGETIHISEKKTTNPTEIVRNCKGFNLIKIHDQEFTIKYLKYGEKFSVCLSFQHDGEERSWIPKQTKDREILKGEFDHMPVKSKKNMILQNQKNHPTFILRKMKHHVYEVECHKEVNPIIAFSIGLSQIIGPVPM